MFEAGDTGFGINPNPVNPKKPFVINPNRVNKVGNVQRTSDEAKQMAFDIDNFKEVGGPGNSQDQGQVYSQFSDTDSLATMLASGYLDDLADKFKSGDSMIFSAADGCKLVKLLVAAGVVSSVSMDNTGVALAVTNPSAIAITHRSVDVTSSSATPSASLADGAIGQLITITLTVDDGTMVVTPATRNGYATITFADAGDSVTLEFKSVGWTVIGQGGVSTGPVVA